MKVLLIRPDREDIHLDRRGHNFRLGDMHQPIGLLYLGAMLEQHGVEVEICDEVVDERSFDHIERFRPDIVGITVTSMMMPKAGQITAFAKERGCQVILGGPHISARPRQSLERSGAHVAVLGEGEYTIVEICEGRELADIPGIAYWKGCEVVLTASREPIQDLDALPLPARHLVDLNNYRNDVEVGFPLEGKEIMIRILTARGCPYRCTNCCSHVVFGRKHRTRDPARVVDEMEAAIRKYGIHTFTFIDDNLPLKQANIEELCRLIIQRRLKVKWCCYARVGTSLQTLRLMKQAGCRLIAYGVESGSPRIIKYLNKRIERSQVVETFDLARQVGIRTKAFFIIGLPVETEEDFQQSVELAKTINPNILWASIFMPLPGSALYEDLTEEETSRIDWNKASFFHTDDEVLAGRHRRFLTEFYFSFRYLRTLLKMLSYADIVHYMRIARVYLGMLAAG